MLNIIPLISSKATNNSNISEYSLHVKKQQIYN